jgi:hypothetical protein
MAGELLLCFFGDGPYWRDFVLGPAYPSGFSYIWPFRYDDKYVEPSLRTELAKTNRPHNLEGSTAILGARFGGIHNNKVLPIRKVTVSHVDVSAGVYSLYFRCGPLVDFRKAATLSGLALDLSPAAAGSATYLCFRESVTLPSFLGDDLALEEQVWAQFCQLLSAETALPVRDDAKRSLFLRFRTPSTSSGPVPVERLYLSTGQGPIYGAALREGSAYELAYSHRVPWLEGKNTTIAEIPLDYKLPTSSVELNSPTGAVIGNYQVSHISLSALRATPTWEELLIQPRERKLVSQNKEEINAFDLKIPFKVKFSFWYRLRQTWIFVLLLWLALTVVGAVASFSDVVKALTSGQSVDWDLHKYYIPLSAIASAIAAVAIFLLQERLKHKG